MYQDLIGKFISFPNRNDGEDPNTRYMVFAVMNGRMYVFMSLTGKGYNCFDVRGILEGRILLHNIG